MVAREMKQNGSVKAFKIRLWGDSPTRRRRFEDRTASPTTTPCCATACCARFTRCAPSRVRPTGWTTKPTNTPAAPSSSPSDTTAGRGEGGGRGGRRPVPSMINQDMYKIRHDVFVVCIFFFAVESISAMTNASRTPRRFQIYHPSPRADPLLKTNSTHLCYAPCPRMCIEP